MVVAVPVTAVALGVLVMVALVGGETCEVEATLQPQWVHHHCDRMPQLVVGVAAGALAVVAVSGLLLVVMAGVQLVAAQPLVDMAHEWPWSNHQHHLSSLLLHLACPGGGAGGGAGAVLMLLLASLAVTRCVVAPEALLTCALLVAAAW